MSDLRAHVCIFHLFEVSPRPYLQSLMTIALTDEQGKTQTKSVRLDSLTIEATIPELRSLAVFFTECTREVLGMSA